MDCLMVNSVHKIYLKISEFRFILKLVNDQILHFDPSFGSQAIINLLSPATLPPLFKGSTLQMK